MARRIDDEKQRKKALMAKVMMKWREDWNLFVRDALGVTLDKEQQAILSSVQHNHRTSVASGTARGKDFVAACAALCFLYLTPRWNKNGELIANTKVALTAPTGRQVDNIMMPEISRLWGKAKARGVKLTGKLNASAIQTTNAEWFLTGFKADEKNHEAWSGFHAVNTMFVITEASGIAENIFNAIEGNLQGNSRILLVFNPNTPNGYAARSQKSARWQKFRLNSLTAPNVKSHKILIPGQVDYEWVKDKLENWCTKIDEKEAKEENDDFCFEEQWYHPDDLFRIKVLGKLPQVGESNLIPAQWIEAAIQRWKDAHLTDNSSTFRDEDDIIGADVAGMGRDDSCFVRRRANWVASIRTHNSGGQADHMRIAGEIATLRRRNPQCYVSIDTIGEGAGVYSACLQNETPKDQHHIISCKFSEGAADLHDVTGQNDFVNMRAYLFWAVRDWLDPKNNTGAMLPPDDRLAEEATEIMWARQSNGKIIIEPKDDIKKRLGRSPDRFDALANTFYPIQKEEQRIDLRRIRKLIHR